MTFGQDALSLSCCDKKTPKQSISGRVYFGAQLKGGHPITREVMGAGGEVVGHTATARSQGEMRAIYSSFVLFLCLVVFVFETVPLLCSSDCPETFYVDQAGL